MQILIALLAYQQFRLSEQMALLEIAYHKDASVANESRMNNDNRGLEQRLTRTTQSGLENLRIEMGHQLEILNTSIRDLELQISRRLSEQESKFYENWKEIRDSDTESQRRIHQIKNQVYQMYESLRFYLPQKRSLYKLSKTQFPLVTSNTIVKKIDNFELQIPSKIELIKPEGSRANLFPPLEMLDKRNYKIFKSDQGYLFFKGKGIEEHLGYQLTTLLLPNSPIVRSSYLRQYRFNQEILDGTIQEYIINLSAIESNNLHTMSKVQLMHLYAYFLVDYILGNNDRDFLFSASTGKIYAVDTDASFNFQIQKWFESGSFLKTMLIQSHNDPQIREFLVKKQLEIQSVSDELIKEVFQQIRETDRWGAPQNAKESLEILILRKRKLGEFVNSLLVELTI
ncbi:MAG: hypothetical protein VX619_10335 [bacterium]|nr:hypothetical protein [bacterium]